jgi:hypothetical protein
VGEPSRCGWATSAPEYVAYHDDEWGRPLRGVTAMFERMSLEGFQSGLSWLVILRKRPAFRAAFAGFDPAAVARFDDADVARLLADAGIVRNRLKIEATVANARHPPTACHACRRPGRQPRVRGDGQGAEATGAALRRTDHVLRAHASRGPGR